MVVLYMFCHMKCDIRVVDCNELQELEKGFPLESLNDVIKERLKSKSADAEFRVNKN